MVIPAPPKRDDRPPPPSGGRTVLIVLGIVVLCLFGIWLLLQIYYATHCAMVLGTRICR